MRPPRPTIRRPRADGPPRGARRPFVGPAPALVAAAALAAAVHGAARVDAAAGAADAPASMRLVATWAERPWRLQAGAFAEAVDVALGPDGSRWVLDARQSAIHRLAADGTPRAIWPLGAAELPDADGWTAQRLAV